VTADRSKHSPRTPDAPEASRQAEPDSPSAAATAGPVLSVCVPTFDRPTLLARALQSVAAAGPDAAGAVSVVISDNSPAASAAVIDDFRASWPGEVLYLPNATNIGQAANMNQSLARAPGQWLLMLHDDDQLRPGGLRLVLDELAHAPADVLLFGVFVTDGTGHVRRHQGFTARRHLEPAAALRRLLNDSSFVRMPAIVMRRDAVVGAGLFDPAVGQSDDFDLFVRLFARYGVTCVPGDLAVYTVHEDSATSSMFVPATIEAQMRIFDQAAETGVLPGRVLRRAKGNWFHQFILAGAYRQMRAGQLDAARATMALFRLPDVRELGRSRRWWPLRLGFEALLRLPSGFATWVARWVGRLSPERFWLP